MPNAVKDFEHWGALPVYTRNAMVATADVHATETAVDVLRERGTVIDAAVAAAFALCVTQPGMCGLGGGGHLLARFSSGATLCLDFREQASRAVTRDMFSNLSAGSSSAGWLAAAVPGTVKGLEEAHRRFGRLPWARVLQPAIQLARTGHPVSYLRSRMLAAAEVLHLDSESRRILLRGGRYFEPGEILAQPELASTLHRIAAHGAGDFYYGAIAGELSAACAANGSPISKADLASYACAEPVPLNRPYRDYDVWTMPLSSAGGIGLLQMLAILEGTNFTAGGPLSSSFFHYVAEASRRVFADRAMALGDAGFDTIPDTLLDPSHTAALRDSIQPDRATPSSAVGGSVLPSEVGCTTHISVLDSQGNAAALTFTINGRYGSGVTVPGLGFLLNNNMDNFAVRPGAPNHYGVVHGEANAIAPAKRPLSSMTPTIVCRGGRPEIVIGTPGGPTIVSATAQALLYMIEFGWNPRDAVTAPRIHHQWMPDVLYIDHGFPADVTRALERRGHRLQPKAPLTDMNAILFRDGWLQAGVDCRRESHASGF
jgi:gamma-glutamyltranspeptidase/glutathione hydrolase